MRWLGLPSAAWRSRWTYVAMRESHGRKLADLDSVQGMLGDVAMQIEIGRLLTMRAAAKLDAATMRARRSRWPRSSSRMSCTAPPTSASS
jgi:alkylation response protein AidB-like acyl-CoA dehydrogenase